MYGRLTCLVLRHDRHNLVQLPLDDPSPQHQNKRQNHRAHKRDRRDESFSLTRMDSEHRNERHSEHDQRQKRPQGTDDLDGRHCTRTKHILVLHSSAEHPVGKSSVGELTQITVFQRGAGGIKRVLEVARGMECPESETLGDRVVLKRHVQRVLKPRWNDQRIKQ